MKRLLSLAILLISCTLAVAQGGYNIPITLKPYKNAYIYLGYYYGKMKALADSALLDANGKGVFTGKKPLDGGIYFIVSPKKEILFEVLIDKQQQFAIAADSATLPNNVVFTGSAENSLFQLYTRFTNQTGSEINSINASLKTAKNDKDSARLRARLKQLSDRMQLYRDSMIAKNPNSFLTALFQAMKEPVIPPAAKHPGGKYDSMYAYRYYKKHYWDGVSFSDGRLVRTPFFEAKLEKYYKELVVPNPDSIKKEVDHMLLYARSNTEMFKFLMVHFVQKYINPEYMGQDAVFVHLFEKYINTGQTAFFTEKYREHINKRAYSLMANLIGQPAANLELVDTLNKPASLYDIKSNFTVICFWDPTCSHCKEVVPKVDSIYKAKWKNEGVAVYGVMVDGGVDLWKKFINDNKLTGWTHVHQLPAQQKEEEAAGRPNYRQLYDVYQTPVLYLLDKDKHIIAKKLTYLQLNEVIDLKLKNKNSN
ncbi:redoxin domain-containing protein [Longitalea luteola]|uniref:redoxin domain-containing protein n=1 Tax=Longitalea luteola TaxID=2812563 RepID=UPI001A96EA50|nr:redoxin domain-containing protein [Longitalea luteola]